MNKVNRKFSDDNYRKNNPWYSVYCDVKTRCNNLNFIGYKYYGGRGIKCEITLEEVKKLWFRDKAYLMKKPSINRIKNEKNYKIDNCEFIELSKNIAEMSKRALSKIVIQRDLQGNFIKEWSSASEVGRQLKINKGNVVRVCLHKKHHKTAYGFIFEYKDA